MRRARYADRWPGNYRAGMWMFLLHRISGVALALYAIGHVFTISLARLGGEGTFDRVMRAFGSPAIIALDLLLVWAILFHAFNGLRLLLLDMGIGIGAHKALFWVMMAAAGGLMVLGVVLWSPYILGRPLT